MARTDALVLGAGIVGTSIALHLAKRGLSVALVDRGGAGEGTSFGNAGIIEGNTIFPQAFPSRLDAAAAHRAQARAGSELSSRVSAPGGALARVVPGLVAAAAAGRDRACDAAVLRPRRRRARGADRGIRRWRNMCARPAGSSCSARSAHSPRTARERDLAATLRDRDPSARPDEARALEPSLEPVFRRAIFLPDVMSVSNPLALTRAYARRFEALGGVTLTGDARTLAPRRRAAGAIAAEEGIVEASHAVVALGPVVAGCAGAARHRLPLGIKRGYHRHFRAQRQCRPGAAGARRRQRLLHRADAAGDPPHHRRRVRRARCAADAGAVRPVDAGRARALSARRSGRADALVGRAALLCRLATGDRARARASPGCGSLTATATGV